MAHHIFFAPMVKALLAGRKTHSGRILKSQPPEGTRYSGVLYCSYERSSWFFNSLVDLFNGRERYESGDRLEVCEMWRHTQGEAI